jgi:DedD protein
MADLKDKMLPAEKAGPDTQTEAVAEESDLEFYKALRDKHKEPKPQVTRAYEEPAEPKVTPVVPKAMVAEPEVVPEKPVAAEPEPEVVPEEAKPKPTEPETVPVKVAVTEKPIPQPDEKAIKKEEPKREKTEQAGRYTVQVAAFKNVDRARELIVYLKKKGYDAYQATAHLPDKGTYHRVRIGHFTNKKEAVRLVSKLGKNNLEAVVVRE